MTTLYQIAPAASPRKMPSTLLAKRLARNGARHVAVALETGFALAVAGLFFVAIRALHLWEARWKPRT
jgi:hypothetical protein